jgi:hypothetical protein
MLIIQRHPVRRRQTQECRDNSGGKKIGNMYSLEYIDISQMFFMTHQVGDIITGTEGIKNKTRIGNMSGLFQHDNELPACV